MKKLRITVEGKAYEVTVETVEGAQPPAASGPKAAPAPMAPPVAVSSAPVETPAAPPPTPGPSASSSADGSAITSPLAGIVASVTAQTGQRVEVGDQILVLEAMKMNTFITATKAGTINEIAVKQGDAVEEGQVLARVS